VNKTVLGFFFKLLAGVSLVLGLHLFILHSLSYPLWEDRILLSYIINFLLAFLILFTIFSLRNTFREQLGFIFMGGSLLKFLFFFLLFYPVYKADGEASGYEFAAFFVPYLTCLLIEFPDLIKILRNNR